MSFNRLNYDGVEREGKSASTYRTQGAADSVTSNLQQVGELLDSTIRQRPVASLAVGLTLGVILGWVIKRR